MIMARLTKEQQAEYEEEQEYANENASITVPGKPRTSVYERIANATKGAVSTAERFHKSPAGQGLQNFAHRVNSQQGLSDSRAPQQRGAPQRDYARFSNDSPQAPQQVNQGSVLHPGTRLYVIEGSMVASGGGQRINKEPRQRQRRGPGGAMPGFGNDPGL